MSTTQTISTDLNTGHLPATTAAPRFARNAGTALDLDWVASVQVNTSAVERRAGSFGARRSVKKVYQAAWLLRAIAVMDNHA